MKNLQERDISLVLETTSTHPGYFLRRMKGSRQPLSDLYAFDLQRRQRENPSLNLLAVRAVNFPTYRVRGELNEHTTQSRASWSSDHADEGPAGGQTLPG